MTTATFSHVAAGFRHHPFSCFAAGFISVLLFQVLTMSFTELSTAAP